jgi:S1-C subfamily serine protease
MKRSTLFGFVAACLCFGQPSPLLAADPVTTGTVDQPLAKELIPGNQVNPLLEGATFGPAPLTAYRGGVEIVSVTAGSKAAGAGLRKGDIITSVDEDDVAGPHEFVAKAEAGSGRLLFRLIRDSGDLLLVVQ